MTTTPFTYLIGWSKLNKFYYGVRFAEGARPSDLWNNYYTSSEYVKKFRLINGEPDIVQIRKTFTSKDAAITWERRVLEKLNVPRNERFLNRSRGSLKRSVGFKKIKQLSPIKWRTFYVPSEGILYSSTTSLYTDSVEMSINVFRETPNLKKLKIPEKYRIRLNNGMKTIYYDSRLPIPQGWVNGYLFSDKQIKQCKERIPVVRRTETFRFKNVKTGEMLNTTINEFHKITNLSYQLIKFLTDGKKKVIKEWTIFDTDFNIWRDEIPRTKGNWWETFKPLVHSNPVF